MAGLERMTDQQALALPTQQVASPLDVIEPRVRLERFDSSENGMVAVRRVDRHLGELLIAIAEMAMVSDPFLSENHGGPCIVHGRGPWAAVVSKGVCRGSKADHGLARLGISDDV